VRTLSGMRRLREFWIGETDIAPLALFRILYGLQLFNWFWQLFPNLTAFFTDEGILPRRALLLTYADRFSLLNLFGEWWQVALVWLASCAVALCVAVGWHTRLACFLAFVLVSSFSWRDPLILDGSDFVFRVVPLWLTFTNAGDLYSLDAFIRGTPRVARGWALPIRLLEFQVGWIYLTTGVEKLAGRYWVDGTATHYALQLEHTFGRWWARPIALQPFLTQLGSWGTLAVELAFLPLAMTPSRATRLLAVVAAAGLHLGILTLMNVGNFPVIMLSALVLFIPPEWVRRVMRDRDREPFVVAEASPRGRNVVPAALLLVVAIASFATAVPRQLESLRPSGDAATLLRFLSLDQRWDMFSPDPAWWDWWLIAPARLADDTTFDLYTGAPAADRSERYSDPFYTRWVKVHERIAMPSYADYRLEYARHFCRARNRHLAPGQAPLDTFEVLYVERTIQAPGEGPPVIREFQVWSHEC
jgi:Vitamin K-dependent gamma-carboxylase